MYRTFCMRIPTRRLPDSRKQWSSQTHTKPLTLKTDHDWLFLTPPFLPSTGSPRLLRMANTVNVSHIKSARGCQVQHALFGDLRPCVQREAIYWSNVLLWRWIYTRLGWSEAGPTATMLALCHERSFLLQAFSIFGAMNQSIVCSQTPFMRWWRCGRRQLNISVILYLFIFLFPTASNVIHWSGIMICIAENQRTGYPQSTRCRNSRLGLSHTEVALDSFCLGVIPCRHSDMKEI